MQWCVLFFIVFLIIFFRSRPSACFCWSLSNKKHRLLFTNSDSFSQKLYHANSLNIRGWKEKGLSFFFFISRLAIHVYSFVIVRCDVSCSLDHIFSSPFNKCGLINAHSNGHRACSKFFESFFRRSASFLTIEKRKRQHRQRNFNCFLFPRLNGASKSLTKCLKCILFSNFSFIFARSYLIRKTKDRWAVLVDVFHFKK